MVCQRVQQAEGVIDVLRLCREVIAVVAVLYPEEHLLGRVFIGLCHPFDVMLKHGLDFSLCESADGGELLQHGDVLQIVDGREDAELREFCDTRDEAELDHGLTCFQGLVELLHHFSEWR